MFNFDNAVHQVIEWFTQSPRVDQETFLNTEKESLIAYHSTLGRAIRNEYRLWERNWTPEIDEQGVDNSSEHPDAISMSVIEQVWAQLHEKS